MTNLALKHSAELPKQGFLKDSFGFKMSKKVAELTQVVHMLFSRNHEREVELDSVKTIYEAEIQRIIKEAQTNSERLEFLLRDATRQRQREIGQAADNTALLLKETQERMETMKQDLIEERNQTLQFKELLSQAQQELERTRQGSNGVSEILEQTNVRLSERETELLKLKTLHKKLQEQCKTNERELEEQKMHKRHTEDKLIETQTTVMRLNKSLEDTSRKADEMAKKLQLAEEEIKFAKRELKRKFQSKNYNFNKTAQSSIPLSRKSGDKSEEIDALRREIDRLRMELSNREGNFNRVFAKFQPVVVSPEANNSRVQSNRMMMVTPSSIESDFSRKYHQQSSTVNSSRSGSESPFLLRPPGSSSGSHNSAFAPTVLPPPKLSNTFPANNPAPKLTNGNRNGSPHQFRLVYSK